MKKSDQGHSGSAMKRVRNRAVLQLRVLAFLVQHRRVLRNNHRFHNKHQGERCFVLCNGPSVLKQDLLPLRNEVVMSVSSGYLHRDFDQIRPAYHFVPPVTYGMITEQDVVRWFWEMDAMLGEADLFLGGTEHQLVQKYCLFPERSVNYLCVAGSSWPGGSGIIDMCGRAPGIGSAPIMCLFVALYMGFREIYLIGADHDSLVKGEYKYSFEPTVLRGKDSSVDHEGNVRDPIYDKLTSSLFLWTQYRHLKRIAEANEVKIFNATEGGMLDEFARVRLSQVLGN